MAAIPFRSTARAAHTAFADFSPLFRAPAPAPVAVIKTGAIEEPVEEEVEEEEEEERAAAAAAAVISKRQMSFKQDWKAFCVASTSRAKSESSAALFKLINDIRLYYDEMWRRSSRRRKGV